MYTAHKKSFLIKFVRKGKYELNNSKIKLLSYFYEEFGVLGVFTLYWMYTVQCIPHVVQSLWLRSDLRYLMYLSSFPGCPPPPPTVFVTPPLTSQIYGFHVYVVFSLCSITPLPPPPVPEPGLKLGDK